MPVYIERTRHRGRGNTVVINKGSITIQRGPASRTPLLRSLENWLRQQARLEIERRLSLITTRLKSKPNRVYIMGQRTKWGSCSVRQNLSFNWRLIMAPPEVLNYIVVHEVIHLTEPYHSSKFWLIVRSYCPDYERHRRWLKENEQRLMTSLRPERPAVNRS